jgi:nuclear pore complex protein Nup205
MSYKTLHHLKQIAQNCWRVYRELAGTNEAVLTLGDQEYKTNKEFQQCAERVSKALNLNEVYAAHLVILALPQSTKFDRSQAETAIYLHYSRRQYLFGSLLQIVRLVADPTTDDYVRTFLLEYVTKLCQDLNGKSYPGRVVDAMKSGRDEIGRLDERQRNRSLLRDNTEVYSDEDLRLRRKLVAQEVDTMALVLQGLVRLKFLKEKDGENILSELKAAEKLDLLTMNLISPVIAWISQTCGMDDNVTANTTTPVLPAIGGPQLKRIHKLVVRPTTPWKSGLLGAYIQMHWLSSLNGLCKLEDNAAAEFTYETDILNPAQAAVKQGGFDFAIKCILKPARTGTFTPPIRHDILQFLNARRFQPPPIDQFEIIFRSQDSKDLAIYQLEHLVQLFISHLADVLKQIRLVEEDKALAEGSIFDYSEQSFQHNATEERDYSLEVFFLLISQIYSHRPDSGEAFLSDPDSALYGFLNWSSGVKPVSMLWTFIDLMSSLAEGPNCSLAVNKLFSQDTSDQPRSKRFHQSWDLIFGAFQYYAENLAPPPPGSASIGRQSAVYDRLEIDEETTIVLKSYLRLIRSVAANSHEVKLALLQKNDERVLSVARWWST